jgi:hypothetical protein
MEIGRSGRIRQRRRGFWRIEEEAEDGREKRMMREMVIVWKRWASVADDEGKCAVLSS